jgi:hypothetical protein
VRIILWFVCMSSLSSLLFGQEPKKVAEIVPADRRLDTYAVYSAVLAHPSLSHPDNNQKYLVLELSGVPMEKNPATCTVVPVAHRAAFAELLQDREKYQTRFLLERAFRIAKPYDLISEAQAHQFTQLRLGGPTTDEVERFRGAVDLITLGNVYFDQKRTLAAVYTEAWCADLCGFWTWRFFIKNEGDWVEQQWTTCITVATARQAN